MHRVALQSEHSISELYDKMKTGCHPRNVSLEASYVNEQKTTLLGFREVNVSGGYGGRT